MELTVCCERNLCQRGRGSLKTVRFSRVVSALAPWASRRRSLLPLPSQPPECRPECRPPFGHSRTTSVCTYAEKPKTGKGTTESGRNPLKSVCKHHTHSRKMLGSPIYVHTSALGYEFSSAVLSIPYVRERHSMKREQFSTKQRAGRSSSAGPSGARPVA